MRLSKFVSGAKQHFTRLTSVAFTLLYGYGEAFGHQAKVKIKRVKSNLCLGSDHVYRDDFGKRDDFRGLALH